MAKMQSMFLSAGFYIEAIINNSNNKVDVLGFSGATFKGFVYIEDAYFYLSNLGIDVSDLEVE